MYSDFLSSQGGHFYVQERFLHSRGGLVGEVTRGVVEMSGDTVGVAWCY